MRCLEIADTYDMVGYTCHQCSKQSVHPPLGKCIFVIVIYHTTAGHLRSNRSSKREYRIDISYRSRTTMFQSLEEVIKGMEESSVTLEQSFDMYNRGMKILKECSRTIDEVEKKVLVLDEDGETHEF